MASLTLGLLADTSIQLSSLQSIAANTCFSVGVALLVRHEKLDNLPTVDAWIVRINMDDDSSQNIIEQLDKLTVPVIYDEEESYTGLDIEGRAKRLSRKIAACGFTPIPSEENLKRAKYVWVLAASAGGPEAVLEFIQHVSPELSDVALIYAQHMDNAMAPALVRGLQRHFPWHVHYCSQSSVLNEKSIYLVSPEHQLEIDDFGVVNPSALPWVGFYKPCIDQVLAKIWRKYGKCGGVIVFSGMGDDGSKSCRMIKNAGGQVWAQKPETCAIDSMPQEVLKTNCVNYVGSPEQLAKHFSYYHKKRMQEEIGDGSIDESPKKKVNGFE